MSVRERMLATVVLGFIVLAGAVLMIQQFIWRPLRSRDDRIRSHGSSGMSRTVSRAKLVRGK